MTRTDKETILNQHAKVVWFTGLSGAGKTTIANELEKRLFERGFFCTVLDGDLLRNGVCKNLGFQTEDRFENIRRVAEIAKLFLENGIIVIVATISPQIAMRELARQIIGEADFIEVFINASLESCEKRDTKGLYQKARQGLIPKFTGISDVYETPTTAFDLPTDKLSVDKCLEMLFNYITSKISLEKIL